MIVTLFFTFLKIGLFTIGGGYAMIPMIEREVTLNHKWISKEDFFDLVTIAQSAPGVFAVNISIFIGYRLKKTKGSIACALGAVLPSVVIILTIAIFFSRFMEFHIIENIFKGIRPAVVALILSPTISLGKAAKLNKKTIWVPILSTLAIWALGVSPILIVVATISGAVIYYIYSKKRGI
ncbi:MAG TPA: chromate transporter [Bacteroidaceae bacterium]|nr:chromate transporter [Bacteroidaceae bacterium]